ALDILIMRDMAVVWTDAADIARGILTGIENGRSAGAKTKPVLIGWMAEGDNDRTFRSHTEIIPVYHLPETPALVLSKAASYGEWRKQRPGMLPDFDDLDLAAARTICAAALSQRGAGWLSVEET